MTVQALVETFDLIPHPEGGFYKEVYRSEQVILKDALDGVFTGPRNYCTSIYFLLTSENFSAFHRIKQDEIWHFYAGSTLTVHVIDKNGTYVEQKLGLNFEKNEVPQFTVAGGQWFASSIEEKGSFAFVGCTVAPGFDFEDFELAERDKLIKKYPTLKELIQKYTR